MDPLRPALFDAGLKEIYSHRMELLAEPLDRRGVPATHVQHGLRIAPRALGLDPVAQALRCRRRGSSITCGGSPARRVRVIWSCMMLIELASTSKYPGAEGCFGSNCWAI